MRKLYPEGPSRCTSNAPLPSLRVPRHTILSSLLPYPEYAYSHILAYAYYTYLSFGPASSRDAPHIKQTSNVGAVGCGTAFLSRERHVLLCLEHHVLGERALCEFIMASCEVPHGGLSNITISEREVLCEVRFDEMHIFQALHIRGPPYRTKLRNTVFGISLSCCAIHHQLLH